LISESLETMSCVLDMPVHSLTVFL